MAPAVIVAPRFNAVADKTFWGSVWAGGGLIGELAKIYGRKEGLGGRGRGRMAGKVVEEGWMGGGCKRRRRKR